MWIGVHTRLCAGTLFVKSTKLLSIFTQTHTRTGSLRFLFVSFTHIYVFHAALVAPGDETSGKQVTLAKVHCRKVNHWSSKHEGKHDMGPNLQRKLD